MISSIIVIKLFYIVWQSERLVQKYWISFDCNTPQQAYGINACFGFSLFENTVNICHKPNLCTCSVYTLKFGAALGNLFKYVIYLPSNLLLYNLLAMFPDPSSQLQLGIYVHRQVESHAKVAKHTTETSREKQQTNCNRSCIQPALLSTLTPTELS